MDKKDLAGAFFGAMAVLAWFGVFFLWMGCSHPQRTAWTPCLDRCSEEWYSCLDNIEHTLESQQCHSLMSDCQERCDNE